jgi:4-amino-4-deoxychorismate lyase
VTAFSLIETMRSEPATGILRARLHAARLRNSARKLGFAGSDEAWNAVLEKAASLSETSRLRLEFFADGRFDITGAPFELQPDDTVWTIRIASQARLDSTKPILRHKTSLRDPYNAARAEYVREDADEVILLNEKGEVCEGVITNLFIEADGMLLTPPLSSGCLAGVLRTSLICSRKARVARLRPENLASQPFYVGNSLRGLIHAKLLK